MTPEENTALLKDLEAAQTELDTGRTYSIPGPFRTYKQAVAMSTTYYIFKLQMDIHRVDDWYNIGLGYIGNGDYLNYDFSWTGSSLSESIIPNARQLIEGANGLLMKSIAKNLRDRYCKYMFRGKWYYGWPTKVTPASVSPDRPSILEQITKDYPVLDPNKFVFYADEYREEFLTTADCGFTFEIASTLNDKILWLAHNNNIIAGTENAEWVLPGGINALTIQASLNSRIGSSDIQAQVIGDAVLFLKRGGKGAVEYRIPEGDSYFRDGNLALMSKEIIRESPVVDMDFVSNPNTAVYFVRGDGITAKLLYDRTTGVFAWSRITTAGAFRNAATVTSGTGSDYIFLIAERGGKYYLELLDPDEPVYLDGYREWDGDASGYGEGAVVYDETERKIYPLTRPPVEGHKMYIGYPYGAKVKTMPILSNDRMKKQRITNVIIRFLDSFLPTVKSYPNEQTDAITDLPEPYSGVKRLPFPGTWGEDVQAELAHGFPERCRILSINAEVQ
jgi:hypothetical protein